MQTYIALLRGINVSGQKKIKMADFRLLLEKSGFLQVQTYIQSGNIVFKSTDTDLHHLAQLMEKCIETEYHFHVPVLVLTPTQMINIKEACPFLMDETKENSKMGFAFLYEEPTIENTSKLLSYSYPGEELVLKPHVAYLYYQMGGGKAKMHTNFLENKLKVTASSRNLNTVNKLIEMSKS